MVDPLLFGSDPEPQILAVNAVGDGIVRITKRTTNGVEFRDEPFYPFFHLSDRRFIDSFSGKFWIKHLSGNNFYRFLCAFPSVSVMWDAVNHVIRRVMSETRTTIESYQATEHILLRPDMATQYLMQSGKTLFKGMAFDDIHRMQIDIETYSKDYRFSRADKKEDRIILIAVSDNRGFQTVLGNRRTSEKQLLQQCIRTILERDPDVIEGHNIFNFDLPYILKRCALLGIPFGIGRDGSAPTGSRSRTSFAERSVEYMSFEVQGRHIIDTWLLVQNYDMMKRSMESHGLKYAAKFFGVAAPDRTYIDGDRISWTWDNEPDLLKRYALDDVLETRGISEKLSGSTFYLTQMLPYNYGTLAKLGASAKIESLLLREYLRQRHSLPRPTSGEQTTGGYTDIFYTGVFGPVVHADVESLYPSIMRTRRIAPASDALGIFPSLLDYLTEFRLTAKRDMNSASTEQERLRLDAMQSSYKILINSFYGYLGYAKALFNDYRQADVVTSTGQELLRSLIRGIEVHNGTVIEVDTDGIYFLPPDNVNGESEERAFVERLSRTLPEGIRLGYNGRYQRMMSYKKKNYALLHDDDRITIKGSSLISRSIERFGRSYLRQCIDHLLNDRFDELHRLYIELEASIRSHGLDIEDFIRTETLKDAPEQYAAEVKEGKRNRSAAYEVALRSSRRYRAGSRVRYYITGSDANVKGADSAKEAEEWDANFPDENIGYYLKRLEEFSEKFRDLFEPADFAAIFSVEGLFGFDATAIRVVNRSVGGPSATDGPEESSHSIEFDDGE